MSSISLWHFVVWFGKLLSSSSVSASAFLSISSSSSSELMALYSFFNATNGPLWTPKCSANWNFTCLLTAPHSSDNTTNATSTTATACSDPCSLNDPWYGVTCDGPNITMLVLDSCELSGSLPAAALNALPRLITLDISSNNLTSTLPLLTALPSFMQLYASHNSFIGTISPLPPSLLSVYLGGNELTGMNSSLPYITTQLYLTLLYFLSPATVFMYLFYASIACT
jgi:Leucine-rich repeat (LRR) protein